MASGAEHGTDPLEGGGRRRRDDRSGSPGISSRNTRSLAALGAGVGCTATGALPGHPGGEPDYLRLDEALAGGDVEVTETSAAGEVPELRLENRGELPVLLRDGEELVGAKQNRVLNLTILAPAGTTIRIPVSCVEQSRWDGSSGGFGTAARAIYAEGRARKAGHVTESLRTAGMLWELLDMERPPAPAWWLERYVALARGPEGESAYAPRGGAFTGYRGPLWRFAGERVSAAAERGLPVLDACYEWHSGAYLLETLPSVLYILTRHGDDPEEAIVRAVNDTKDNDTVAAIVGAAIGALNGRGALPGRWLENLSGRTTDRDDGRVFELIAEARRVFWD